MYSIQNIIVGTPLTKEVTEALGSLGITPEDAGYEVLYNGGEDSFVWGYCGVLLGTFDEATDFTKVSDLPLAPNGEQLKKAQELFNALPAGVKDVCPLLDLYFVPSCS